MNDGEEVGVVAGWFERGQYQGRLRVHRRSAEGTSVLAVPVGAIATVGNGVLVLSVADAPASSTWLVYLVRRRVGKNNAGTAWLTPERLRPRLVRLAHLTDRQLHAVLVRVQTLLLDRPPRRAGWRSR